MSTRRTIRLADVAHVHVGITEPRSAASFSGQVAVGLDIKKSKGYSTTAVADAVKAGWAFPTEIDKIIAYQDAIDPGIAIDVPLI